MNAIPSAKRSRPAQRISKAIEEVFVKLIREKGYEAVTVSQITEQANVGRTTFYRYYQSKADVLLSIHARRFEQMHLAPESKADWLSERPPASLIQLFETACTRGRFQPMLYRLGQDVDIIHRQMQQVLALHFQQSLCQALPDTEFLIPLPVLAHSLAGSLMWLLQWWVQDVPPYSPAEMATYAHCLLRAEVLAALDRPSLDTTAP